jgi:hypothetical protein
MLVLAVALLVTEITMVLGGALSNPYWRHLVAHPSATYSPNQLNLHNDSTVLKAFTDEEIQTFNKIVTAFLNTPTSRMWSHVEEISEQQPFIFYHQRKAGGTSIRETLAETAEKENLQYFIPCFPPVDCDTYHIPYDKQYAIYAGHFQWGSLDEAARFNVSVRDSLSCATNYRQPASRIESCIYFRFTKLMTKAYHADCIGNLTNEEFTNLLFQSDRFGQSCLNEPFRVLSGFRDERMLDHLMGVPHNITVLQTNKVKHRMRQHPQPDASLSSSPNTNSRDGGDGTAREVSPAAAAVAVAAPHRRLKADSDILSVFLKLTLEHTRQCPPIVLEIPHSYDLMINRSPIFARHDSFEAGIVLNAHSQPCDKLHGEKLDIVKRYTALEAIVYDAVFRKTIQRLAEEHPQIYLFRMACSDQYSRRTVNQTLTNASETAASDHPDAPPVLLVSDMDSSINTILFRETLEYATGRYTGGVYGDKVLRATFEQEGVCAPETIAIHIPATRLELQHAAVSTASASLSESPATPLSYLTLASDNGEAARCHAAHLSNFANAVLLFRDPFVEIFKLIQSFPSFASLTSEAIVQLLHAEFEKSAQISTTSVTAAAWYDTRFQWYMGEPMFQLLFASPLTKGIAAWKATATATTSSLEALLVHVPSEWPAFAPRQVLLVSPEALLISANRLFQFVLVHHSQYDEKTNSIVWKAAPLSLHSNGSFTTHDAERYRPHLTFPPRTPRREPPPSIETTTTTTPTEATEGDAAANGGTEHLPRNRHKHHRHHPGGNEDANTNKAATSTSTANEARRQRQRQRRRLSTTHDRREDHAYPLLHPTLFSPSSSTTTSTTTTTTETETDTSRVLDTKNVVEFTAHAPSRALLRYASFVEGGTGTENDATNARFLHRVGCTYANMLMRRAQRDQLHLVEQMVVFYKAHPPVLAAVMAEVVSFFTAARLPLDSTSFSYRLETTPGSASHPTKSHP